MAALQGNVPLSLLQLSTPEAVREYCRKLIEVAAPGGGFLLDSGAVLHQCKAENVKAMIQAAHDFGVRKLDRPCSTWTARCMDWLRSQGFLGPSGGPPEAALGS